MLINKYDILKKLTINQNNKKCFIFDLDGTIIFDKEFLSNANNSILKKIKSVGHEVIFATGRPLRDLQTVMPTWAHDHRLVLFGGALSMEHHEVVKSAYIHKTNVLDIVKICDAHKLYYNIDNSHKYYHPDFPHDFFYSLDKKLGIHKAHHVDQIFDNTTHKVLILDSTAEEKFKNYTSENNLIMKIHSYDKWLDIIPCGVNKYTAVLDFVSKYHPHDVFVFGNDFNDIELLLNFPNSILFGEIPSLQKLAKVNIKYNEYRQVNFEVLIDIILSH